MSYDFNTWIDRRHKDALAFDYEEVRRKGTFGPRDIDILPGYDMIPMWVADMNFATAPSVTEAIEERLAHPCFGYFRPSDAYFAAIIEWQRRRNHVTGLSREHIGYENGVLGGVASALKVLCSPGDAVLLHSPTYIGFTKLLSESGYTQVHSKLVVDASGSWQMDLVDMEKKIVDHHIHAAIFCSPHNPTGRVWTKEEISDAMKIFKRHDVWVISDEIWSDLLLFGNHHTPTQSVSTWAHQHTVSLYAPSKTFNLAGLVGSYHIIYNQWLRDRMDKQTALTGYNSMNVLSMHALIGAYSMAGSAWLDELCQQLSTNVGWACDHIRDCWPGVDVVRPEGTYMIFLDCTKWCATHDQTISDLEAAGLKVGVLWQDGRAFGGPQTIRMNLALPIERLKEAFGRLDQHVFVS